MKFTVDDKPKPEVAPKKDPNTIPYIILGSVFGIFIVVAILYCILRKKKESHVQRSHIERDAGGAEAGQRNLDAGDSSFTAERGRLKGRDRRFNSQV